MNIKKKKAAIEQELQLYKEKYKNKLNQLAYDFAIQSNQVKVGDLVTDHVSTIQVTNVCAGKSVWICENTPTCWYKGVVVTKKGTPRKDGQTRTIFKEDIVEIKREGKNCLMSAYLNTIATLLVCEACAHTINPHTPELKQLTNRLAEHSAEGSHPLAQTHR
jgi:hypothetical protein